MTKHLSTLNSISHLASHLPSASRTCCRRSSVSFLSVMSRYNTQSSANSLTLLLVIDSCRSLMYARNKTGPRTVPCGTPLVTGLGVEVSPSSSTRWVLSFRKAVIQLGEALVANAVPIEFVSESAVGHLVEGLAKIQN